MQSQESYLFEFHYWLHHSLVIDGMQGRFKNWWRVWPPQRSCGKVWKDRISSNIWMYNYIYLKFFYKQGWAKKLQGTEKSEKISLKNFEVYFKVSFKVPLKFLQSFF
jgi:hypothetical protein